MPYSYMYCVREPLRRRDDNDDNDDDIATFTVDATKVIAR